MIEDVTLATLEELFHYAISLPGNERDSFLADACAERPVLRKQLQRMIEADSNATGIAGITASEPAAQAEPGRFIGRWKLLERIGCGGLGIVYRATCEADGVTIQAAVKILRNGPRILLHRCFIQERTMLAGLDHPYIARLIDAGVDPGGTSFMAMEFVAGLPLDKYLEQLEPPPMHRLELFDRICEAIAYLHDNGIVHGDLKPSNIVVTHGGLPKLLDFGTACFIDSSDTCADLAALMMTPAYASPEQLAGLGPSVTGDVYSLGCVLRDLLEDEALCRELSAILDKCLARSPGARYQSPREIALEIRRYLEHLPVKALPRTPWYVTRKFLRRNRIACALAGLAVVSLMTGWLVSRSSRVRAERYAEQHRSVVARLVRHDPGPGGPEVQARSAYAAGVEDSIMQMERMQPQPLAELTSAWRRLAYSQAVRALTPQSTASIERSISYGRQNMEKSATADARCQLAESLLHAAILRRRRGHNGQAGTAALEAIQLLDGLPATNRAAVEKSPQFSRGLAMAGMHLAFTGDVGGGRALMKRALELSRAQSHSEWLRAALDLVRFERMVKQPERAIEWCAEARSIGLNTLRLQNICPDGTGRTGAEELETVLNHRLPAVERRLASDPERYGVRVQLARMHLQLGRAASGKGNLTLAAERFQQARVIATELLKADPENLHVRRLLQRIERAKFASSGLLPNDASGADGVYSHRGNTPLRVRPRGCSTRSRLLAGGGRIRVH